MSVIRYNPLSYDNEHHRFVEGDMVENDEGRFVHYSDYEKLVKALRFILREASYDYKGVAEAALLSAGEEL